MKRAKQYRDCIVSNERRLFNTVQIEGLVRIMDAHLERVSGPIESTAEPSLNIK